MEKRTMYDKIWQNHLIDDNQKSPLIFIDRHFIHEVTSPQAFEGLRAANRKVRHPELTFATMDHNVSTKSRDWGAAGEISKKQMQTLASNCKENNIRLYDLDHKDNGIIHIIGPELGFTQPGTTIVCGDSHTSTHGAFGALAFGIGTSEVEHVLATQCLPMQKSKNMRILIKNAVQKGITAKDIILAVIGKIGTSGGQGYVIEYSGQAIRDLSMEGRMTICNMSIEAGARAGLIQPDEKTFEYLKNRDFGPKNNDWDMALEFWKTIHSDKAVVFDKEVEIEAHKIEPQVTWGTNPAQVLPVSASLPLLKNIDNKTQKESTAGAYKYMGFSGGEKITDIPINKVFIGSCTNARIEDLRLASNIAKGRKVHKNVQAIVVPGSGRVSRMAEEEGLDQIFKQAGFEWRLPGCSMCLAMNDDVLEPGDRCASTSNRNFEGRQGKGGRTHLVSPEMAVAAAISGHFIDVREL